MTPSRIRPGYVIADDLAEARIWELVDANITLMVGCQACEHTAKWTPQHMDRRMARHKAATLVTIAHKVRCSRCRSRRVRLWRGA